MKPLITENNYLKSMHLIFDALKIVKNAKSHLYINLTSALSNHIRDRHNRVYSPQQEWWLTQFFIN